MQLLQGKEVLVDAATDQKKKPVDPGLCVDVGSDQELSQRGRLNY